MKAHDFDKKFDDSNEDILDALDLEKAIRPNQHQKRVNVDFPTWMVDSLDKEANRLGVTRQSLIKMWVADKLESRVHWSG
ncbi:MAG: CopG family transcriptional regulator [Alphaproteobacteria bacterium]|nr:CopG family transcriptional regulator [Alphaproteobacteria bacterium]